MITSGHIYQSFYHLLYYCSLSSCHVKASKANLLDNPHSFHCNDYFIFGGIHTCLGVFDDPMFLWISLNSCPLNLLLVRSHKAEIIIIKSVIQRRNNVTRMWVEPRSLIRVIVKTTPLPSRPRYRLVAISKFA